MSQNPTQLPAWLALAEHQKTIANTHMRDLFRADAERYDKFNSSAAGISLDYSKNRITGETVEKLLNLADAMHSERQAS